MPYILLPSIAELNALAGYQAYVSIPLAYRIQSAKIAPRAKEGYLVSIEGLYRHIYKVFLLDKDKIVRARNIRFYNPANLNLDKSITHIANVSKNNNPFDPNDFFYYYI
ncbi:hypothetical protein L249_7305 [Ophiocordyceps polyrhachis-furcata BCC 54312]|uniref:Retroviral polymerase SH3-like domain-containing protein n=1 Tax=Ophiocordyceps polyrhachis-furcata BCC 54312 TaxID=1330021 RepID=A0A367L9L5_9HYPO|nr:hypothetical protein L249_7305 [Ophiocordyceps polyrhachis-furcata BCC 54312]